RRRFHLGRGADRLLKRLSASCFHFFIKQIIARGGRMTDVALLFPGQGSQSVGMLAELAERHAAVRLTFEEAGEVLGSDLWQLVENGPAEDLNRTEITQPAVLAGAVAVWRVWQELNGPEPAMLAGHSLGEYS